MSYVQKIGLFGLDKIKPQTPASVTPTPRRDSEPARNRRNELTRSGRYGRGGGRPQPKIKYDTQNTDFGRAYTRLMNEKQSQQGHIMNIDTIVNQAISLVQDQSQEKIATELITTHPTATALRKLAAEIRKSDQKFELEDLRKVASLITTEKFVDKASMQKRAQDSWSQGYIEGNRVMDLFEKQSIPLKSLMRGSKSFSKMLGNKFDPIGARKMFPSLYKIQPNSLLPLNPTANPHLKKIRQALENYKLLKLKNRIPTQTPPMGIPGLSGII